MLRTLVALAIATPCLPSAPGAQTDLDLSSAFPMGWDYTLNGDPTWTFAGHDGSCMFFRSGPPAPATVYYDAPPAEWAAASATGDFSVYAEVQIPEYLYLSITDPTVGLATIVAATGAAEFRLEFLPDRIALGGGAVAGVTEYAMDTSDDFHISEMQVIGSQVVVRVDGVPRLDATDTRNGPRRARFSSTQGEDGASGQS